MDRRIPSLSRLLRRRNKRVNQTRRTELDLDAETADEKSGESAEPSRDLNLHRLDVRMDSRKGNLVRRKRRNRRGLTIGIWLLGCVVGLTAIKAFMDRVYLDSPDYELGQLFITTDGDLPRPMIQRHAGISGGENLLHLDLEEVKERLDALPQIADVRIERQLPNIVSIKVRERRPVAWLECPTAGAIPHVDDHGWLVDVEGNAFPCKGLADEHMDLPIITIDDLPPLVGKVNLSEELIGNAIELIIASNERLYDEQLEILRVDCARSYSLIVHYRNDASVVFSTSRIPRQLDDFAAILAYAKTQGLQIASLNLAVEINKPVKFYNAPPDWKGSDALLIPSDAAAAARAAAAVLEETKLLAAPQKQLPPAALPAIDDAKHVPTPSADQGSDVSAILGSLY